MTTASPKASSPDTAGSTSPQARSNAREWAAGKYIDAYDSDVLTPVEVQIFVRYQDKLAGRVLDVGCGAGRILSYLVMLGADAHGLDIAPAMVDHCRRRHPEATVALGDAGTVSEYVDGLFDVVIAPDNLVDVFADLERRAALADFRNVLAPDGLLIFSTHDLRWADANPGPRDFELGSPMGTVRKLLERAPADLVRGVRSRRERARNRTRLAQLQQRHSDHAIINDFPHNYSLLHYYISRDAQEGQLHELGYELVECLGADGRPVGPGESGPTDSLHYVARLA